MDLRQADAAEDEGVPRSDAPTRGLAAELPALIETAFHRYRDFATNDPPDGAKAFAAYSAACRSAVQHLDQLLKLARVLDGDPAAPVPSDDIERLIARAEAELDDAHGTPDQR